METTRYYTPKPEEFHIGFEFERASVDCNWRITGWNKEVFSADTDISTIIKFPELHRVKYLDKEDLEDLGFEINYVELKTYGYYLTGKLRLGERGRFVELWYSFLRDKISPYVALKTSHFNGNVRIRIKNKSELKKTFEATTKIVDMIIKIHNQYIDLIDVFIIDDEDYSITLVGSNGTKAILTYDRFTVSSRPVYYGEESGIPHSLNDEKKYLKTGHKFACKLYVYDLEAWKEIKDSIIEKWKETKKERIYNLTP